MIEQLLKYQSLDGELLKIKQEISATESYKKFAQARKFLEKAPEQLDALDKKAIEAKRSIEGLNQKYMKLAETIKDFENLDELVESGADISFYQKNASQIYESIRALKNEINKLTALINNSDDEYKSLKNQTIAFQKQFKEYKEKYSEIKNSKAEDVKKIEAEMSKLEKKIDSESLEKYKTKRNEKIFPVICELKDGRCSKCGMDFSVSEIAKLDGGKFIECETCRRFIYKAQ